MEDKREKDAYIFRCELYLKKPVYNPSLGRQEATKQKTKIAKGHGIWIQNNIPTQTRDSL